MCVTGVLNAAETNIEADNFLSENGEGHKQTSQDGKMKKTNITNRACLRGGKKHLEIRVQCFLILYFLVIRYKGQFYIN